MSKKVTKKKTAFFQVFGNIFGKVCLTVTIFLLTQRSRLGGPSRFLEDVRKAHRKFYRDLWEKVSPQKLRFVRIFEPHFWLHFSKFQLFFQNIPTLILASFSKSQPFLLSPDMQSDWCVVRSRFSHQTKDLDWRGGGFSDIVNMYVNPTENFVGAFEKVSPQKTRFVRIFQPQFCLYFFLISNFCSFSGI